MKSMQKGSIWIVLISIVAAASLAGAAYLFGQNQTLKKSPASLTSPITPAPTPVYYQADPQVSVSPLATPASGVVVVYEASGSFSQSEKDEINKKVVNPLLDYYREPNVSTQKLISLTISHNTNATSKVDYPYAGKGIFDGGANLGFLIMKVGAGIDWWYPECLNGCVLSAEYKAKYPEVASKVE